MVAYFMLFNNWKYIYRVNIKVTINFDSKVMVWYIYMPCQNKRNIASSVFFKWIKWMINKSNTNDIEAERKTENWKAFKDYCTYNERMLVKYILIARVGTFLPTLAGNFHGSFRPEEIPLFHLNRKKWYKWKISRKNSIFRLQKLLYSCGYNQLMHMHFTSAYILNV